MTPPMPIGNKTVGRLKELTPALEWDIVMNRKRDYLGLMAYVCQEYLRNSEMTQEENAVPVKLDVRCAMPNGTLETERFTCE